MKLGKDFWLALKLAIAIIKAFLAIFGDDDERNEAESNGF